MPNAALHVSFFRVVKLRTRILTLCQHWNLCQVQHSMHNWCQQLYSELNGHL